MPVQRDGDTNFCLQVTPYSHEHYRSRWILHLGRRDLRAQPHCIYFVGLYETDVQEDKNIDDSGIVTITILGIVHHPVFYLKCNVPETGLCLLLRVESTQAQ
jgi:hypothetical protein